MQIELFDVARGFCTYVVADNGNVMLIDCGRNEESGFEPADYLLARGCTGIERFFSMNYDDDHLRGLPRLRQVAQRIPIGLLHRNKSVGQTELRVIKGRTGGVGTGLEALFEMMETYIYPAPVPGPHFPNLQFYTFSNSYPEFTDTNNLSQVLFLHYPGLSIVFPGDLEKAGWEKLLLRSDFREHLGRVNVFVASHHGRENGYAASIFNWCKPDVVIISDERMRFDSQEHCYGNHCTGGYIGRDLRKVLSTRNDGMITIIALPGSGYRITTSR